MVPSADAPSPTTRPRAVIASGAGRYADPWHPFPETSPRIAEILRSDGWDVEIVADPDAALAALAGFDVLVVNAGDPQRSQAPRGEADPGAATGLDTALARGIGVLALHCALSSLRDYPAYRRAIGGEWVPDHSFHPPISDATIRAVAGADAGGADAGRAGGAVRIVDGDFTLFDERYTDLVLDPGVTVHAVHDLDGVAHPVVWTREAGSGARAAVSALGHDTRAYDCADYRDVLARLARWAGRRDA